MSMTSEWVYFSFISVTRIYQVKNPFYKIFFGHKVFVAGLKGSSDQDTTGVSCYS